MTLGADTIVTSPTISKKDLAQYTQTTHRNIQNS